MSIDVVRDNLIERFNKPLEDFYKRRIIFWQDEDKEFEDSIDELQLDNVKIIKLLENNNFQVKKLLTVDDLESNYLLYNTISYANEEDNWLLDVQLYSEEFRADYFSIKMNELNIENTTEMRKAIKLYKRFLENKERRHALQKISSNYNKASQLHIAIMSVLCGLKESSSQNIIIEVLSNEMSIENNECISNIKKFGNIAIFWDLVKAYTGYEYKSEDTLNNFANHLLLTALSQNIGKDALKGLEEFVSETSESYCYALVNDWINSEKENDIFKIARQVEEECNLVKRFNNMDMNLLVKANVFPAVNEVILSRFFNEIREKVVKSDEILEVNGKRRTSSWIKYTESYFDCVYNIAKIQEFIVANIESYYISEPKEVVKLYTKSAYKMDTYHRKFYLAYNNALNNRNASNNDNEELKDLLKEAKVYVDDMYENNYLRDINNCWLNATKNDLETLGYVSEIPKQRFFYSKYVKSSDVKNSKVFVIISDALRYEVAVQLSEELMFKTNGKASIEAMQSILPSVTSFGMSALLPNKEISVRNDDKGLTVLVDGNLTDSREKREQILQNANKNSIALRYADLHNMKSQERRELTTGKEVIYIYHDSIDAIGDKPATESGVFDACEKAIAELINTVKFITNDMNGTNIFITADHGFLYTHKPLAETDKISKENISGDIFELGKRYALVSKESSADYLTKICINNEIKGLDMVAYTPKDTVRIKKSGGGENFVHGGMSLQEMIVPVITYKNLRSNSKGFVESENVEIEVVNTSRKISNMIFFVNFFQKSPVGGKIKACTYNVYFIDENGAIVSDTHQIIADLSSQNNQDRTHKVTFNLKPMEFSKDKTYKLVIANNIDIPVEIEYCIDIPLNMASEYDLGLDW